MHPSGLVMDLSSGFEHGHTSTSSEEQSALGVVYLLYATAVSVLLKLQVFVFDCLNVSDSECIPGKWQQAAVTVCIVFIFLFVFLDFVKVPLLQVSGSLW